MLIKADTFAGMQRRNDDEYVRTGNGRRKKKKKISKIAVGRLGRCKQAIRLASKILGLFSDNDANIQGWDGTISDLIVHWELIKWLWFIALIPKWNAGNGAWSYQIFKILPEYEYMFSDEGGVKTQETNRYR